MEVEQRVEALAALPPERRVAPRMAVDEEATLLLVNRGTPVACRIVELSLTGCRMQMREQFLAGIEVRVEAAFRVRGIALRFSGVTEWTDDKYAVGIRFLDLTSRRRDELVDVLCEVAAENAAKAVKEAAEEQAARQAARMQATNTIPVDERIGLKPAPPVGPVLPIAGRMELAQEGIAKQAVNARAAIPSTVATPRIVVPPASRPSGSQPAVKTPAKPAPRERRAQSRHEIDTSAVIYLVNIGCRLPGRILDLSLGGCRIRTDERFPVGIYTRVETEFRLEGLPFRLGGVIQALHDRERLLVGVRFLDMSQRKREQVEQLIEEIEEMRTRRTVGEPGVPGEGAGES